MSESAVDQASTSQTASAPGTATGTPGPPLYPELFIGLVAAVGTDHDHLCGLLEEALRSFSYKVQPIRLTKLLREIPAFKRVKAEPVDDYIRTHQKAGDDFREAIENKNALAALGIGEIREVRYTIWLTTGLPAC